MLFDFHQKQNSKKPKSVHATYIVSGTKRIAEHNEAGGGQDGADAVMQSSPFMSSMPEQTEGEEEPVKKTTITITREEELEGAYPSCG
jgi:DNA polymerase delta subunit 3